MDYNFSAVSTEELLKMEAAIAKEKAARRDTQFGELVSQLCNAFNELRKEFPTATLEVERDCYECGNTIYIDLFEYFNELEPSDICK